jgi:hypothetical protein
MSTLFIGQFYEPSSQKPKTLLFPVQSAGKSSVLKAGCWVLRSAEAKSAMHN